MVLGGSGGGWCEVGGYMMGSVSGSRPSTLRLIEKIWSNTRPRKAPSQPTPNKEYREQSPSADGVV